MDNSQTDRQTDKPAIHWKTAVFDKEDNWAKLDKLPAHVKKVYRQKEVCPETGNIHWQIHVHCHRQVRLTQLTSWIKYTKWIPVWGDEHIKNSIAYCSKIDSAISGTQRVDEGESYLRLHELLLCVARAVPPLVVILNKLTDKSKKDYYLYKNVAPFLVAQNLNWINKLSNPMVEKSWNMFHGELFEFLHEELEECGGFIIEAPTSEGSPSEWLGD